MSSLLSQLPAPPQGKTGWPWTEETPAHEYAGQTHWPRISLVTPSYNQASYLEETIRSILLQNYPNLQYIVMDGGSTDGTVEILKLYTPWISHWESEPDRGQSHAINKGLARCDGYWFNWINSDDCLLPGALEAVSRAGETAVVVSGGELTGETLAKTQPLGHTRISATLEDTLVNHYICQQGLFFRTDTVKALHGVREELHFVMDLDLFTRVLVKHGLASVCEIPETIAFFRRHQQAKTSTATEKFLIEERQVFHGLGNALGLSSRLLNHVAAPAAALPANVDTAKLDAGRLSRELAIKFWWEGPVEIHWLANDFGGFRRELRAFRHAFPEVKSTRITKLTLLALLPDFALRLLSRFRARA